jgi:hypothetical protein
MSFRVPSFSFIADLRIRFEPGGIGDCPADGATLAFAPVPPDALGGGGGNLGLFASPSTVGTVTAFEINTWSGQGLGATRRRQGSSPRSRSRGAGVLVRDADLMPRPADLALASGILVVRKGRSVGEWGSGIQSCQRRPDGSRLVQGGNLL